MCLICIMYEKEKMKGADIRNALREMTVDPEHKADLEMLAEVLDIEEQRNTNE